MSLRCFYFLLCTALGIFAPTLHAVEPTPDELAVYSTLLGGERLVVLSVWGEREDLDADTLKSLEPHRASIVAKSRELFPKADQTTIESFFTRRPLPALITAKTDLGVRCVVLDKGTSKKLYPNNRKLWGNPKLRADGWAEFKNRYPRATAVSYVTRVGFNADATQALVFLQQKTGSGDPRHVVLLDRRNGVWAITKKMED